MAGCFLYSNEGKTGVSGTVAANLARKGKNTIYLDCDPQGNTSSWYYDGL